MFNFEQLPSKTGTIAAIKGDDVIMQVAFHTGSDNMGDTFLRISSAIVVYDGDDILERFHMQYHMFADAVPYTDDVVLINAVAQREAEVRHAA